MRVSPPPRSREQALTFSIVTPSYQQGDYIERTLLSVLGQGYPRLEYVVQDGGSTDGTRDVLERYRNRLARFESAPDRGQSHAINLGFRGTSGEVMAYLNSDDLLLPGTLNYVADYLARHPDVDAVYGHRIVIDEHDREVGRWLLPAHDPQALRWADYIPQETLFWRRSLWDRVGGIDESFRFAMDWDLLLRFEESGARIVRLDRFLGAFRVHSRQKTSAEIHSAGQAEMAILRRRCFGYDVTDREIHENLQQYRSLAARAHLLWSLKRRLPFTMTAR